MLVCDARGLPLVPTRLMQGASLGLACYPWSPGQDNQPIALYIISLLGTMCEGVITDTLCCCMALAEADDDLSKFI